MTLTIDEITYTIRFWHENAAGHWYTHCWIEWEGQGLNRPWGLADCSSKDQFNRGTGRKVSLTKAMQRFADKQLRTNLWRAYFAARQQLTGKQWNA